MPSSKVAYNSSCRIRAHSKRYPNKIVLIVKRLQGHSEMHVMYKFKSIKISQKLESLKKFQTHFCLVLQKAPDKAEPKVTSLRIYQNNAFRQFLMLSRGSKDYKQSFHKPLRDCPAGDSLSSDSLDYKQDHCNVCLSCQRRDWLADARTVFALLCFPNPPLKCYYRSDLYQSETLEKLPCSLSCCHPIS